MSWEPLPTPNPSEFAVRVWVSAQQVASKLGGLVAGTTAMKSINMDIVPSCEGFGDYVYLKAVGPNDAGQLGLIFGKPKTDEEKYTPYQDPTPSSKPFGWDTVVKRVEPIVEFGTPRSGVKLINGEAGYFSAPEYYAQVDMIPGGEYVTRFLRYDFLAPTKFDIQTHDGPVPTAIMVMLPGREAIFIPKALHPTITIGRLITSVTQGVGGTATGSMSSIKGQAFPATGFETWGQWVVEHDQRELESGLWHCWKVIAFPPPEPELTKQLYR